MNHDKITFLLAVGWMFGMLTALVIDACYGGQSNKQIIQHACAHYDAKTGAFTWNDEVKP